MSRSASGFGRRVSFAFKSALGISATILAAGCSGGGCGSGCSALGGSQPIPGGFPIAKRVQNGAGIRLTKDGLNFIQNNIGTIAAKVLGGKGPLTFPIGSSSSSITVGTVNICPSGPNPTATPPQCEVEIDAAHISGASVQAAGPHDLNIAATVPIRLQDLPITGSGLLFWVNATACLDGGSAGTYANIPVTADISLEQIDPAAHPSRANYTKINVKNPTFDQTALQNSIRFCGGSFSDTVLNGLKGLILPSLLGGLTSKLAAPLQNATCMKETVLPDGTKQCPDATFDVGGTCRYGMNDTDECVPMLLGLEERFNLSGLLASISPGTQGGLDFLLASGGDMDPAPGTGPADNGVTLHMFGGAEPHPISQCVPAATLDYPTDITLPDELQGKAPLSGWMEPTPAHFGIGLSERYLNHAFAGAYNSGLLCVGISSASLPSLNAGILSVLLPSIKHVSDTFLTGNIQPAIAITLRPQNPPVVTVGDGTADFSSPLLDINMKDTAVDFYSWSEDRYVRLFTGLIDLRIPLNITSSSAGLQLTFASKDSKNPGPIEFNNPRVSNNNLLLEGDDTLKSFLGSIGGLVPTSALSGIKPINLGSALSSLGMTLTIPPEGIRKMVTADGKDRFLGIFGSLGVSTAPVMPLSITNARVIKANVDPRNFDLATVGKFPPSYAMHAESPLDNGAHAVEYRYKVDDGLWTNFSKTRDFDVRSPMFFLQGKHEISVSSRIVGAPDSEGQPAVTKVIIDTVAPSVAIKPLQTGVVNVTAKDLVSAPRDLKVEARFDGGDWNVVSFIEGTHDDNLRTVPVPTSAKQIDVRVTDEAGNVGSSSAPLIRGIGDPQVPSSGSGCGCELPGKRGNDGRDASIALGAFAVLGAVVERRRRRNKARQAVEGAVVAGAAVLSIGAAGCSCGSTATAPVQTSNDSGAPEADAPALGEIQSYVKGSYTSAVATSDGKVWVAGYNEGDPVAPDPQADLCVGQWDPSSNTVTWKVVDGIGMPDPTMDMDPNGWRNGVVDDGPDVGLYTSMVLDSKGNPLVAYHDRTNGALKVAHFDGTNWTNHQVDAKSQGWAGRFTSMVMVNGVPWIAYQVVEPGTKGAIKSTVRVAHASSDSPAAATDWTLEDVSVDDNEPCIQSVCAKGETCIAAVSASMIPSVCAPSATGCDASCSDVCVASPVDGKPACLKAKPELGMYVPAMGLFNSIAATPTNDVGLVFYDRTRGNIRAATNKGGKWTVTPGNAPLDGYVGTTAGDATTGDRGVGATLAIDSTGNWHVAYVDGLTEQLLYKFVPGGDLTKAAPAQVVDDGLSSDGTASGKFSDGVHVVGENAQLTISGSNVVIVYQDSTSGTLRIAKSTGGAMAKWTRSVVTQDGFAGFWPKVAGNNVLNFYRSKGMTVNGDPAVIGDVRGFPLP